MLSYLIIAFLIGYILSTKRPPAPSPSRHPKSDTHPDVAHPCDPPSGPTGQTAPASQDHSTEQFPLECDVASTPENIGTTSFTAPDGESEIIVSTAPGSVSPSKSDENPGLVDAVVDGQTSYHPGWGWEDERKPGSLDRGSRDRPPHMHKTGWKDDCLGSSSSSGYGSGRSRRQVKQSWGRKWVAGSEKATTAAIVLLSVIASQTSGAGRGGRQEGLPLCELIYQRGIAVGHKETCEICEDVLHSRIDLRNHKKAVHDWSMLCTACLQTFPDGFAALELVHGAGSIGFEGIAGYLADLRSSDGLPTISGPEPASTSDSSATSIWSEVSSDVISYRTTSTPSRTSTSTPFSSSSDSEGWPGATVTFPLHVKPAENVCSDCWADFSNPGALEIHREGPCDPTPPSLTDNNYPPLPRRESPSAHLLNTPESTHMIEVAEGPTTLKSGPWSIGRRPVGREERAGMQTTEPNLDDTTRSMEDSIQSSTSERPPDVELNKSYTKDQDVTNFSACDVVDPIPVASPYAASQEAEQNQNAANELGGSNDTPDHPHNTKAIVKAKPLIGHAIPTQVKSISPVAARAVVIPPSTTPHGELFAPSEMPENVTMVEQIPSFALPAFPGHFVAFSRGAIPGETDTGGGFANTGSTSDGKQTSSGSAQESSGPRPAEVEYETPSSTEQQSDAAEENFKPSLQYYHPADNYMEYHPSNDPPPPPPTRPPEPLTLSEITKRQQSYRVEVDKARSKCKKAASNTSGKIPPARSYLEPKFDDGWTTFGGEATVRSQGGFVAKATAEAWAVPASESQNQLRFGGW